MKNATQGMVVKEKKEIVYGAAYVIDIFNIPQVGTVAGCDITSGNIKINHSVRLIRDGIVIYTGKIHDLTKIKDDVKLEYKYTISIEDFNDIKKDDIIEAFGFESEE